MAKGQKGTRFKDYLSHRLQDPEFRREYEALGPRFDLAAALIQLRLDAGLTQEQLAGRIGTKQAYITRVEGKPANLTLRTLAKIAGATGAELVVRFEPVGGTAPVEVRIPAAKMLAEGMLDRFE